MAVKVLGRKLSFEFKFEDVSSLGQVIFIQYADPAEAKHHMEGYLRLGRELTVVFAEENRKKPTEMRLRTRGRSGGRSNRFHDIRRSPPPRCSRSPPPRGGRGRDYNSPPP